MILASMLWAAPGFAAWDNYLQDIYTSPQDLRHAPYAAYVGATEFETLVAQVARNVDVFAELWRQDPRAEIVGGACRDWTFFVLKAVRKAQSRLEFEVIASRLRHSRIQARTFMGCEADLDVIAHKKISIDAAAYGLRKIDFLKRNTYIFGTPEYYDEINQGYIAAEKIRIGSSGLQFGGYHGDGIRDIFLHRLTITFPGKQFWNTQRAKKYENHPILLTLRFIRLLAAEYDQIHHGEVPTRETLVGHLPLDVIETLQRTVDEAANGISLLPYLRVYNFGVWLNASIRKSYYHNATAAHMLMQIFGVDRLIRAYRQIQSPNHYLFARTWNMNVVNNNLRRFRVDEAAFYIPPQQMLPGRTLYHGASTMENLLGILRYDAIPSGGGAAGQGVYGVAEDNIWYCHGGPDVTAEIRLKSSARVVDVTRGEGARVFEAFSGKKFGADSGDYDRFSEAFGVELLRYPFTPTAFVLKNSDAIQETRGHRINIDPADRVNEQISKVDSLATLNAVIKTIRAGNYTTDERRHFGVLLTSPEIFRGIIEMFVQQFPDPDNESALKALKDMLAQPHLQSGIGELIYGFYGKKVVPALVGLKNAGFLQHPESIGSLPTTDMSAPGLLSFLQKADFSLREIIVSMKLLGMTAEVADQLIDSIVAEIHDPIEMADLAAEFVRTKDDGSMHISVSTMARLIHHLLSLCHSITEIKAVEAHLPESDTLRIAIWELGLPMVHTAADFLELTEHAYDLGSFERNSMHRFFSGQIEPFMALQPTGEQVYTYMAKGIVNLHDRLKITALALQNSEGVFKTGADFVGLFRINNLKEANYGLKMALDDTLQRYIPSFRHLEWRLEDFRQLLDQSVSEEKTLTTVWQVAIDQILENKDDHQLEHIAYILRSPQGISGPIFEQGLNQFIGPLLRYVQDVTWTRTGLVAILSLPQWRPENVARILLTLAKQIGPAQGLAMAADAVLESGSQARLGFQEYLENNFDGLFDTVTASQIWMRVLTSVEVQPPHVMRVVGRSLQDPHIKISHFFELLQMLSLYPDQINVEEILKSRFARLPMPIIQKALHLPLPNRTRAYILLLSRFAYPDEPSWQQFVAAVFDQTPALAREVYLLRFSGNVRSLARAVPRRVLGIDHRSHVTNLCSYYLRGKVQ